MQPLNEKNVRLPQVIAVAGPTASGKTGLAVELAKKYHGEVVSADSMQIYREMRIGTARPTDEEMQGVPHHLLGFVEPDQNYSVAEYAQAAEACIREILSRGRLPIVCGGTGQYLHALIHHLRFGGNGADDRLRAELRERAETEGTDALYAQLTRLDAAAAEKIHPNNRVRLIRALELALSGAGITQNNLESRQPPAFDFCVLALNYADRDVLRARIGRRTEQMLSDGLADEAKTLRKRYGVTARAAIGYKELEPYFAGEASLEECAERIRIATCQYAKRQLTWLRSMRSVNWIFADRCDPLKISESLLEIFLRTV